MAEAASRPRSRPPAASAPKTPMTGRRGKLPDIARHVGRAARIVGFAGHFHHRDGRLRRNARYPAPDELVEHEIADHQNALGGELGDQRLQRGGFASGLHSWGLLESVTNSAACYRPRVVVHWTTRKRAEA